MSKNISQLPPSARPPPPLYCLYTSPKIVCGQSGTDACDVKRYRLIMTNNICLCVALPMYINRRDRRDRRDHRF